MNVKSFVRKDGTPTKAEPPRLNLVRKTRLMSSAEVMLVRVEVLRNGEVSSSVLKLSTPVASKTFADFHAALKAYKAATRRPVEATRLKRAA